MKDKFIIIETTYPNLKEAKNLAVTLLQEKIALCIQFHPIKSTYIWEGIIENNEEILVRIKSKNALYSTIETIIQETHSYENPEIIAIEIINGSAEYLDWLNASRH